MHKNDSCASCEHSSGKRKSRKAGVETKRSDDGNASTQLDEPWGFVTWMMDVRLLAKTFASMFTHFGDLGCGGLMSRKKKITKKMVKKKAQT